MSRHADEQWKNFTIEDFDAIDEDHEFSNTYQRRKTRLIRKYSRKNVSGRTLHRLSLPTAAAIAVICGIGTGTVYAGVRAWNFYAEKTNRYQIEAGVADNTQNPSEGKKTDTEDSAASSSTASGESGQTTASGTALNLSSVPAVTVQVGYVPDGLTDNSAEKGGNISYTDDGASHGYVINTYIMDTDDSFSQDFVKDYQTVTVGDHSALYIESQNGGFDENSSNRNLYIAFPEYQRIVNIWGWGTGSQDELMQVGEGISLVPTGENLSEEEQTSAVLWSTYIEKLSRGFADEDENESDPYGKNNAQLVSDKEIAIHSLGETFSAADSAQDYPITASVTDAQLLSDFSPLSAVTVASDSSLSMLLTADGKLGTDEVIYYNSGNGSDSLGSTVRKEEKHVKFLYLTIDYTNTGDQTIDEYLSFGTIQSLIRTDSGWKIWNRAEGISDGYQHTDAMIGVGMSGGDLDYIDASTPNDHGAANYLRNMAPGETRTIHMGFLIDEEEAAQPLYVNLNTVSSGGKSLDEESLASGFTVLNEAAEKQKEAMS